MALWAIGFVDSAQATITVTQTINAAPGSSGTTVELRCRDLEAGEMASACGTIAEWTAAFSTLAAAMLRCEPLPGWSGRSSHCDEQSYLDADSVRGSRSAPDREAPLCPSVRAQLAACRNFSGRPSSGNLWCPPQLRAEAPLWSCLCEPIWQDCGSSTACGSAPFFWNPQRKLECLLRGSDASTSSDDLSRAPRTSSSRKNVPGKVGDTPTGDNDDVIDSAGVAR